MFQEESVFHAVGILSWGQQEVNMIINIKKQTVLLVLVLLLSLSLSSAANIGVSPANINFDNVLRGGYAQRPITLTIDTDKPTLASISVWGDIASWINVSETKVSVSKGNPSRIMVSVSPPSDVPNGNYTGFVRINGSKSANNIPGAASSVILPTLDLAVNVIVTDIESIQCSANDFRVYSVEQGEDIIFTARVSNDGNIKFYPKIKLSIWNQDSTNLVKEDTYANTLIIPTQENEVNIRVSSKDLDIGQYWLDATAIDCYNEQTLTFDVLEKGALRADGILEKIIVVPWANINDIVPINISFRNTGQKPLDAKFSGKIMFNNKIVQLLESDKPSFVALGSVENFQFYFTPREAGRYIISGRVFYDSKRTYEQSAILNIRPGGGLFSQISKFLIYAILLIIIAILIYKIRKERESYLGKWRFMKR